MKQITLLALLGISQAAQLSVDPDVLEALPNGSNFGSKSAAPWTTGFFDSKSEVDLRAELGSYNAASQDYDAADREDLQTRADRHAAARKKAAEESAEREEEFWIQKRIE